MLRQPDFHVQSWEQPWGNNFGADEDPYKHEKVSLAFEKCKHYKILTIFES